MADNDNGSQAHGAVVPAVILNSMIAGKTRQLTAGVSSAPIMRVMEHGIGHQDVSYDTIRSMIDKNKLNVKVHNAGADTMRELGHRGTTIEAGDIAFGNKVHNFTKKFGVPLKDEHIDQINEGVRNTFHSKGPHMAPGMIFSDNAPRIGMGGLDNNAILMHELGHAKSLATKPAAVRHVENVLRMSAVPSALGAAYLTSDKDKRKYAPIAASIPMATTFLEEGAANYHAAKHIAGAQGGRDAVKYLSRVAAPNMLGYAGHLAGVAGGTYLAGKVYGKMFDKKASWREGSLEALRDFGVIGAADLAAMALHEKFNRENTAMPVEHPENVYLQKVAEQLEQEKQANLISSIANGAKAAWGGVKSVAGDFAAKNPGAAKHVTNAWDKTQAFATKHPIATSVGASVAINKATD